MGTINKVKGYRVMLGYNQEEMAKVLNVSLKTYQNKETGSSDFTIKELAVIKDLLNKNNIPVSIDELA